MILRKCKKRTSPECNISTGANIDLQLWTDYTDCCIILLDDFVNFEGEQVDQTVGISKSKFWSFKFASWVLKVWNGVLLARNSTRS